jgi:hypothetical protein
MLAPLVFAVALFCAVARAGDEPAAAEPETSEHALQCAELAARAERDGCTSVRFVSASATHNSRCVAEIDAACLARRAALLKCRELLLASGYADEYEIVDVDVEQNECIKRPRKAEPEKPVAPAASSANKFALPLPPLLLLLLLLSLVAVQ